MKYYHIAPEKELSNIFSKGLSANEKGDIIIIALQDDFMLKKFVFDVYAHEVLGVDTYCAFEILARAIEGPLFDTGINSIFSDSFRASKQQKIDRKQLKLYEAGESYEGMGLFEGVFPVEHKDKFTDVYKRKVLEYLQQVVR
jgi:hypothetical protein